VKEDEDYTFDKQTGFKCISRGKTVSIKSFEQRFRDYSVNGKSKKVENKKC
jgi:hypothetical protein